MDQLLQKLVKSKAIMDAADGIKRGDARPTQSFNTEVSIFDMPQAK